MTKTITAKCKDGDGKWIPLKRVDVDLYDKDTDIITLITQANISLVIAVQTDMRKSARVKMGLTVATSSAPKDLSKHIEA